MDHHTSLVNAVGARVRGRSRVRTAAIAGALALGVAGVGAGATLAQTPPTLDESEVEVFVGLEPVRFVDTRIGLGTDEGQLDPGETITVKIGGEQTVPAEATSVALSTAIPASATEEAFFTIWPTGTDQPFTSVNNANPGVAVPNFTLAKLGDNGSINVFNERGNSDFVIDVVGYYTTLDNVDLAQTTGALLTGAGVPDDALGDDGDAYVDTDTGTLYIKVDGVWVAAGTPTAETDSALSASNEAGLIDLGVDDTPLTFDTPGVGVGSAITQADDDTFVLEEAGVYEVQFVLGADAALAGSEVRLQVDGADAGPAFEVVAGTNTTGVTLVEAATDGAELELVTDAAVGTGVLNSSSIVIELIAVD